MHVTAHLDIDLLAHNASEEVTCLLNLKAPVPAAALNRPGQTLVVVLDRSGSMGGAPLEGAKRAISQLVRRLAPQDAFGLVTFDDHAGIVAPVRTMADHDLPALDAAIDAIMPGGSTDLSAGYLLGLREAKASLAASGLTAATLLIVSDGCANAGVQDPAQLRDIAARAYGEARITTATLGLSEHYDETALAAMSLGGNGDHRFAADIDQAIGMIGEAVDELLDKSIIAASLRIRRQPGLVSDVLLRNGMAAVLEGDDVVVSLGDLYAAEERGVLFKFRVPGMPALGLATIADVILEYTALPEIKEHTVTLPIAVNVVPGDDAKGRIPNPVVEVAGLLADIAESKATASEQLRRGDSASAQRTVAGSAQGLAAKRRELSERGVQEPSLNRQLDEAARELLDLAGSLQHESIAFNAKMTQEAYTRTSRNRVRRSQMMDQDDQA